MRMFTPENGWLDVVSTWNTMKFPFGANSTYVSGANLLLVSRRTKDEPRFFFFRVHQFMITWQQVDY